MYQGGTPDVGIAPVIAELDGCLGAGAHGATAHGGKSVRGARQNEREDGTSTELARNSQLAIHRRRQFAADRKTQSDTLVGPVESSLALDERLEDVCQPIGWDSGTGIADMNAHQCIVVVARE